MWQDDWKYTPLSESRLEMFAWGVAKNPKPIDWASLGSDLVAPKAGCVFIFENGHYVSSSTVLKETGMEAGISLDRLDGCLENGSETEQPQWKTPEWFLQKARPQLAEKQKCMTIAEGVTLWNPIYVLHFYQSSEARQARVSHWKMDVKPRASVQIIEMHIDLDGKEHEGLCYAQTQICLGEGAHVQHHLVHQMTQSSMHIHDLSVSLQTKAHYESAIVSTGGKKNRGNYVVCLQGEEAKVRLHHMNWAKRMDSVDAHIEIQHNNHCGQSQVVTRGVAQHRARASITGKIVVGKQATKNQATLENKNLLLSETAEINSRPQLEIENNDLITCSHGATIGYLEQDALFYLRSRGIPEADAKRMLIESFIAPVTQALEPRLSDYVTQLLLGQPMQRESVC